MRARTGRSSESLTAADDAAAVGTGNHVGRRSLLVVAIATTVAAILGWVVLLVAARVLGPRGYAEFAVFWGVLFGLAGAVFGVQQETTRSVHHARSAVAPRDGTAAVRPVVVALGIGACIAAATAVTSPLWGRAVLGTSWAPLAAAASVGVLLYAGQCAVLGVLAGSGRWHGFAGLVGAEAVVRVSAVLLASVVAGSVAGLAWAAAVGMATWVLALPSGSLRAALRARADQPLRGFLRGCMHAMLATGSTALLVSGFPVLLQLTSHGHVDARAGIVLAAVTATRAPLLMPLNAYQGVAVTHFARERAHVLRALRRPMAWVAAVAVVGSGAAFVVGPALMLLLFGPSFLASGWLLAALVLAAGALGLLTVSGTATLALNEHRAYSAGWLVAAVVTVLLLLVPAPVDVRTAVALSGGPVAGMTVHLAALRSRAATAPT